MQAEELWIRDGDASIVDLAEPLRVAGRDDIILPRAVTLRLIAMAREFPPVSVADADALACASVAVVGEARE